MTDKPKRYSLENPQTKEMWEKRIRVNLKDSYEGYKDFYTWYQFLQERYQAIYDDYLQLKCLFKLWILRTAGEFP